MEPAKVVDASSSEDQSLCWSPNGKWIAYHSHKENSDDIWLRAADGKTPERRVTFLGRGAETGWPRWSHDGRWLVFDGAVKRTGEGGLYVIGVDQESGRIVRDAREVQVKGIAAEASHAEWLPDSATLVVVGKEAPGRHVIFTVSREGPSTQLRAGGDARVVHRYATEHDAPGLGVSPDGRHVAFVAPAPDGYFQIFRMPLAGGPPAQVTTDPSHKTQPAWSPGGGTIAFTVWNYETQFWTMAPGS
jgi:Tol biopolymer transport system component